MKSITVCNDRITTGEILAVMPPELRLWHEVDVLLGKLPIVGLSWFLMPEQAVLVKEDNNECAFQRYG